MFATNAGSRVCFCSAAWLVVDDKRQVRATRWTVDWVNELKDTTWGTATVTNPKLIFTIKAAYEDDDGDDGDNDDDGDDDGDKAGDVVGDGPAPVAAPPAKRRKGGKTDDPK